MPRTSTGRVAVAAAAVSIGLTAPFAASAAPTPPTPGHLSISLGGEVKHQEGTATAVSVGAGADDWSSESSAIARGANARAEVRDDQSVAEATGDAATAVVTGTQGWAVVRGAGASATVAGSHNRARVEGDGVAVGINDGSQNRVDAEGSNFALAVLGSGNVVDFTNVHGGSYSVIGLHTISCRNGTVVCSPSPNTGVTGRRTLGLAILPTPRGPLFGLFGNGVDAAADCTGDACNGGRGGLIWGNGGTGANGGFGGAAGLLVSAEWVRQPPRPRRRATAVRADC